ncbi:hypothetical protein [Brachybacterium tyrofermentans]|uniref:hypothetical protein n=1 Tax=Brachybacterium tyrofermentans TaxID=47848 RepID=UPI003F93EFFF
MRRNPLRPGGVPSLPEYFPGANERVSGIEIASEPEGTSLVEDHPEASFLETGRIRINLPSGDVDDQAAASDAGDAG